MENKNNKTIAGLENYFEYYLGNEPIQETEKAAADHQLNTIAIKFMEFFSKFDNGSIIDIGCGEGALFAYLCKQTEFRNRKGWLYYAVDFEENLKKVNEFVFNSGMTRRFDWKELKQFYNTPLQELDLASPVLLVCRNVLHELNIEATTQFFEYLTQNKFDLLILQDLINFKQGERGNVCWDNEILKKLLEKLGFQVIILPLESKSKAKWLNALVKQKNNAAYTTEEIKNMVTDARKEQYDCWTKEYSQKQDAPILTVDRDLQIAALASQLKECEVAVKDYKPEVICSFKLGFERRN